VAFLWSGRRSRGCLNKIFRNRNMMEAMGSQDIGRGKLGRLTCAGCKVELSTR
jgi:hypothetical protein